MAVATGAAVHEEVGGRRRARVVLAAVLAAGAAPILLVLMLRVFRRNRELLLRNGPFRRSLQSYNDLTRTMAGTRLSTLALLTHTGRRSGRSYQTSVGATTYGDGFLLPLTYGPKTDWYRNLVAAGAGTLTWQGRTYRLERPEVICGPEPLRAWPIASRMMLQIAGIQDFVWLHQSTEP